MLRARELDTNIDTACGFNPMAPWVGPPEEARENFDMEGEDFHEHQSFEASVGEVAEAEEPHQESDPEPWVPTEAEKDAASRLRVLSKGPSEKAVKRPRSPRPSLDVDDDVPDLAEIFDNYDTPHPLRISICRAYASYLAAMQPKKPRAARKR